MRVAIPLEQCWHAVPGGTARTAIDLATALHRRPDTTVVGVSAWHRRPPPAPWVPQVPVRAHRLPRRLLYETWHGLGLPRVERRTGPIELVHAIGGAVPGTRRPLVVTVHDLAFLHHPEMFSAQGRRFFGRFLDLVRARAVQVQVPSLATLEDCADAGIERTRLRHVPWGCSVGRPGPVDIALVRNRLGIEGPYVVCVGTREPRKNLRRLLQAWAQIGTRDARLVVVGPSGWGDLGLPDAGSRFPSNVSMTGFVDDDTRDALYAGAEFSCYPSLFEGFGLPVLESMALGCPVITSSGTSTEELVSRGAGVCVDPTDVSAIAEAMTMLLHDPAERRRLAGAGRARAAAYTWEAAATAARRGYAEVVQR